MKKVFIIHCFKSSPNKCWRPWLMGELAQKDIYACALPMPNPHEPSKDEWVKTIKEAIGIPNEEMFLVGHSLGVPAILRYLETLGEKEKIGGVVLVSGPCTPLNIEDKGSFLRKIDNFLDTSFDFSNIIKRSNKFSVIHGDNDDKVPFSHAETISNNIGGDLVVVKGGGHLDTKSGHIKLPEVLEALEKMIK